jgi:DNA invertase Pin-like site-specific DNA recombinase
MIQERVKSGLERARAQGKRLGRPATEPRKVQAVSEGLRAGGVGTIKLAKLHGVGVGTVQRIKAALTGRHLPNSLFRRRVQRSRGTAYESARP